MQLKEDIVSKIRNIPPLSEVARQILTVMSLKDHEVNTLIELLETDTALTDHILAVVHSRPCSKGWNVATIAEAMACLGERGILGIVLNYCTDGLMFRPLAGYETEQGKLWEHNLLTAIASSIVASTSPMNINQNEAYIGGLLHDIGKSVLSEFLKGAIEDIIKEIDRGTLPDFLAAEEEKLGTDHCIIGATIAKMWKLPAPFTEIIRHHHHPQAADEKYQRIIYTVHLGDIIAMMKGSGTGSDSMCYQLQSGFREILGIRKDQIPAIILHVDEKFQSAKAMANGGIIDADHTHSG